MKKVLTIHGSSDGVIGVATNKKVAFNKASKYLGGEKNLTYFPSDKDYKIQEALTYSRLCKELRKNHTITIYKNGSYDETIELQYFTLNL